MSPYWIQLHGLPLEGFTMKNVLRIGRRFDEVVAIEDPVLDGKILRNFARVRVLVNVEKSLITSVSIARPGLSNIWISA